MLIENCVYNGKVTEITTFFLALSIGGLSVGLPDNRTVNYHLANGMVLDSSQPTSAAVFRFIGGETQMLVGNNFVTSPIDLSIASNGRFGELFSINTSSLSIKYYVVGSSPIISGEGSNGYFATFTDVKSAGFLSSTSRFYLIPFNTYRGNSIVYYQNGGINTYKEWVLNPSKFLYNEGWIANELNAFAYLSDAQYGFWYTEEMCGGCLSGEGCFYNDYYSYGTTPIPPNIYECRSLENYHKGPRGFPGMMGAQGPVGMPGNVGAPGRRGEPGTESVSKINWASSSGFKLIILTIFIILLGAIMILKDRILELLPK